MEKIEKYYAAFELAMNEEKLYRDCDFLGICLRIGADPVALDEMLVEELGYSGQDLVDLYLEQDEVV
ncbi:MAG: hypothetical protein J6Z47_06185 [Bacteroidales bacterium]|nr:hypothetical protein [Bacteroidales bacterium]